VGWHTNHSNRIADFQRIFAILFELKGWVLNPKTLSSNRIADFQRIFAILFELKGWVLNPKTLSSNGIAEFQRIFAILFELKVLVLNAPILTAVESIQLKIQILNRCLMGEEWRTKDTAFERPCEGQRVV
jgi:hypothetical protein